MKVTRSSYAHSFITPAVFEWTIAIGYSFYLLTFWYDLRLSKGVNKGDLTLERVRTRENHTV